MKLLFKIIVVIVVILGVLFLGRNVIAKYAIEKGVETATGLPLKIGSIDLGAKSTHVGINELNLISPKGFGGEVMFHAPEIFVDYNLSDLLKGKVHLEDIRLNFDQFTIVKNKNGELNLDALKPKGEKAQKPEQETQKAETKTGKAPQIQIDHLAVKIGKIVYKDYSQGSEPVIKEYPVNISEEIDDVTDPNSLLNFIATKALMKTALSSLGDFNMEGLKDVAIPQETMDTLKGQVESIKGMIKFPTQ